MTIDEILSDEMRLAGISEDVIKASQQVCNINVPTLIPCSREEISPEDERRVRRNFKVLIKLDKSVLVALGQFIQREENKNQ